MCRCVYICVGAYTYLYVVYMNSYIYTFIQIQAIFQFKTKCALTFMYIDTNVHAHTFKLGENGEELPPEPKPDLDLNNKIKKKKLGKLLYSGPQIGIWR
jgi:hypothetical protein